MRTIRLAFAMALTMLLTTPAWSQADFSPPPGWSPVQPSWSPGPPYNFVQGQADNTLLLLLPAPGLLNFEAGDIFITYSSKVFTPIALLTDMMPAALSVLGSSITNIGVDMEQANILLGQGQDQEFSVDVPAGPMFGVQFAIKGDAPLGSTDVAVSYSFSFTNLTVALIEQMQQQGTELPWNEWTDSGIANFSANITAVPEPETWAMMLAGLALVGAGALRGRRKNLATT